MAAAAALETVSLTYGDLLDLSLGDAHDYGVVSFALLKDLLCRMLEDLGLARRAAVAYPASQPPDEILRTLTRRKMAAFSTPAERGILLGPCADQIAAPTTVVAAEAVLPVAAGLRHAAQLSLSAGAATHATEQAVPLSGLTSSEVNASAPGVPAVPDLHGERRYCGAAETSQAVSSAAAAGTQIVPPVAVASRAKGVHSLDVPSASSAAAARAAAQGSSRGMDVARPQSATDVWQQLRADKRIEGIEAGVSGIAAVIEATKARVDAFDGRLVDAVAQLRARQLPLETDIASLVRKIAELQEQFASMQRSLAALESKPRLNFATAYAKPGEVGAAAARADPAKPAAAAAAAAVRETNDGSEVGACDGSTVQSVRADAESDHKTLVGTRRRDDTTTAVAAAVAAGLGGTSGPAIVLGTATVAEEKPQATSKGSELAVTGPQREAWRPSSDQRRCSIDSDPYDANSILGRLGALDRAFKRHDAALDEIGCQLRSDASARAAMLAAIERKENRIPGDRFVQRQDFDERMRLVDGARSSVENQVKQLVDGVAGSRSLLNGIEQQLESKAGRQDVTRLRDDQAKLRVDLDELASVLASELEQDSAAAFRRRILPFKCLSCSKNMALNKDSAPGPSLPAEGALKSTKSAKPYTSYELDSLRRLAKLSTKPSAQQTVGALYHIPRPCGGAYTMVDPLRAERKTTSETLAAAAAAQFGHVEGPFPVVNIINQNIISASGGGESAHEMSAHLSFGGGKLPKITR